MAVSIPPISELIKDPLSARIWLLRYLTSDDVSPKVCRELLLAAGYTKAALGLNMREVGSKFYFAIDVVEDGRVVEYHSTHYLDNLVRYSKPDYEFPEEDELRISVLNDLLLVDENRESEKFRNIKRWEFSWREGVIKFFVQPDTTDTKSIPGWYTGKEVDKWLMDTPESPVYDEDHERENTDSFPMSREEFTKGITELIYENVSPEEEVERRRLIEIALLNCTHPGDHYQYSQEYKRIYSELSICSPIDELAMNPQKAKELLYLYLDEGEPTNSEGQRVVRVQRIREFLIACGYTEAGLGLNIFGYSEILEDSEENIARKKREGAGEDEEEEGLIVFICEKEDMDGVVEIKQKAYRAIPFIKELLANTAPDEEFLNEADSLREMAIEQISRNKPPKIKDINNRQSYLTGEWYYSGFDGNFRFYMFPLYAMRHAKISIRDGWYTDKEVRSFVEGNNESIILEENSSKEERIGDNRPYYDISRERLEGLALEIRENGFNNNKELLRRMRIALLDCPFEDQYGEFCPLIEGNETSKLEKE